MLNAALQVRRLVGSEPFCKDVNAGTAVTAERSFRAFSRLMNQAKALTCSDSFWRRRLRVKRMVRLAPGAGAMARRPEPSHQALAPIEKPQDIRHGWGPVGRPEAKECG